MAQASLFNAPGQPVIEASATWVEQVVGGSTAVAISVIAIALLGFLMMTGRLVLRRATVVVLGCFVLLGSATLADALDQVARGSIGTPRSRDERSSATLRTATAPPLPPATYDPYAGASLRQD